MGDPAFSLSLSLALSLSRSPFTALDKHDAGKGEKKRCTRRMFTRDERNGGTASNSPVSLAFSLFLCQASVLSRDTRASRNGQTLVRSELLLVSFPRKFKITRAISRSEMLRALL
jgi:hypothetical protein